MSQKEQKQEQSTNKFKNINEPETLEKQSSFFSFTGQSSGGAGIYPNGNKDNNSKSPLQLKADNSPQVKNAMHWQTLANNSPQVQRAIQLQNKADNSPQVLQAKKLQSLADNSPQVLQAKKFQEFVDNSPRMQEEKSKIAQLFNKKREPANKVPGFNTDINVEEKDLSEIENIPSTINHERVLEKDAITSKSEEEAKTQKEHGNPPDSIFDKLALPAIEWLNLNNPFHQEEIDDATQEHLKNEFEVYCEHKLELIESDQDLGQEESTKELSKEERRVNFLHKKERFLNRMSNNKRSFWGSERYFRLKEKWFSDYEIVIENKITTIKNDIDSSIHKTNEVLDKLISKLQDAINIAITDKDKAQSLLNDASGYLKEANFSKLQAEKELEEFGKDKKVILLPQYDEVICNYEKLIGSLNENISGIENDKVCFTDLLTGLSTQKNELGLFNNKVNEVSDVQKLILLFNNEFSKLNKNVSALIENASLASRNTILEDTSITSTTIEAENSKVNTLNKNVAEIKQTEINRREEERKRKEEEKRRKAEEEQKRLEALLKEQKEKNGLSSILGYNYTKDNIKSRGSDYTKKLWTANTFATESVIKISEDKYENEAKVFFEHYELTAKRYLENFYTFKKYQGQQLTASMFVNAAKRIYQKYGHLSYVVPIEMALVHCRLESELGISGKGENHNINNPFNLGEDDKGPKKWVENIKSPEMGIYAYMDFMANDFLSYATPDQLLEKQGETFVTEAGGIYASSPRYEMEIKALMGQAALIRDGKLPSHPVGIRKDNTTPDAEFARQLLSQLGFNDSDLGAAIKRFQETIMYPPLTAAQKDRFKLLKGKSIDQFLEKEKKGIDGIISPRGNTIGLLYFMTGGGEKKSNIVSIESSEKSASSLATAKDLYNDYISGKSDMIALGIALKSHCQKDPNGVIDIFNELGRTKEDNLAYVLVNKATDDEINRYHPNVITRLTTALDPDKNWFNIELKTKEWNRIKGKSDVKVAGVDSEDKGEKEEKKNQLKEFKINDSVGKGGKNYIEDVILVQNFLIAFKYLNASDEEVIAAQKAKSENKISLPEDSLKETIKAITEYQKMGSTVGTGESDNIKVFKGDGNISKDGGTSKSIKEMTRIFNQYGNEKPLGEKMVLNDSGWRTQFRYGYNFYSGDLENEYVNYVKEKTGHSDANELHKASSEIIKDIKNKFKDKKGKWFETEGVKNNSINQRDKEYEKKGNMVCCFDAAKKMLGLTGASAKDKDYKIQTFVEESGSGGKFTRQAKLGIQYIDGQLRLGKAIFVGVDRTNEPDAQRNEGTTDHYIVIVGKGKDDKGWYFRYFDPGTTHQATGNSTDNKLYIGENSDSIKNNTYNLSQIRTNNE